ncbi:MAG: hypothetical protein VKS61_18755 [Candidatus Sericytochromatia bacterium]|nr:hypothetical protein [Candidatus Sericytochromatia bacterium]
MGIIDTLAQKIGLQPQGTLQERKASYEKVLMEAMADGVLTQAEIDELDTLRKQLKLKDDDVAPLRMKAFQRALAAVKSDGLFTPKEERDLEKIAAYLEVDGKALSQNQHTLAKMRVLYEIHRGNLPLDEVPGLGLETGEQTHMSMTATFHAVRKDTRLLSPGIGQVIKAGTPYRMGSGRLNPLAESELGEAVAGTLTVTNRRLMFNSGQHAFRLKYEKLLGVTVFADGMLLEVDTGEPRVIVPGDRRELEVIFAIVSRYLNPPPPTAKPGLGAAPGKPQPPARPQPPRR